MPPHATRRPPSAATPRCLVTSSAPTPLPTGRLRCRNPAAYTPRRRASFTRLLLLGAASRVHHAASTGPPPQPCGLAVVPPVEPTGHACRSLPHAHPPCPSPSHHRTASQPRGRTSPPRGLVAPHWAGAARSLLPVVGHGPHACHPRLSRRSHAGQHLHRLALVHRSHPPDPVGVVPNPWPSSSAATGRRLCRRAPASSSDDHAQPDLLGEREGAPPPSLQAAQASGSPLGWQRGERKRRRGLLWPPESPPKKHPLMESRHHTKNE